MRHQVLAAFLLGVSLAAIAAPAAAQIAQETPAETLTPGTSTTIPEGDTIIVTGTRATDRTLAESPVPIDVIGSEAVTNAGYTEVNRVLAQLVPSFNFPQPSLTDGTDSLRPATLRGLSPDQVLVLINGKRRHPAALLNLNGSIGRGSSSVDLNTIPTLAIDRIEVLRDGASSLYGSDAIAGVINIQLRKRAGGRASVTWGKYFSDLQGVKEATGLTTGPTGQPIRDADGNYVLTDNGDDRHVEDGQQLTYGTTLGLPIGDTGYFNFTGEYRDRNLTNRSGYDVRQQYPALAGGLADPREFTFNRINHRYGDGNTQDLNFFVNAGVDLMEGAELYAFGSYGIRDGDGAGFFRRPNGVRNRDYAASTTSFVPFYANGFLPFITSEIEDYSAAVGVRGTVAGFSADLSYVYGHNGYVYGVENSFNTPFGSSQPQRKFNAGELRFGQSVVNLDLQRNLEVGFVNELSLAIGGEYRDENFRIIAGDPLSYRGGPFVANGAPAGAQVFPGLQPSNEVDASRDSVAGYVEFDAKFSDIFSVQLAGRYEHFSDFGDTVNGKVAARLAPFEWLAFRGSASTGFRAPSLQQQFYATTSTNNISGVLVDILTVPVTSPTALALGSQALKPEKSTNFGGGITFTPISGLNITADYYNIKIRDRVILTENLQGAAVVGLLRAQGFNNVTSARFFVNGVDTRTQGVEVVGSYRVPEFGAGRFTLTAAYNYNETTITDRAALPTLPGLTLPGRVESLRITDGRPRDKVNLGMDWESGFLGATVRANRYGKVLEAGATAATDFELQPKWLTDVEVRAKLPYGVDIAIGANNVFDIYPTRRPAGGVFGSNNYFLPYSSLSPFGFNGRFLYTRASIDF